LLRRKLRQQITAVVMATAPRATAMAVDEEAAAGDGTVSIYADLSGCCAVA
jgi:hypothetical protein